VSLTLAASHSDPPPGWSFAIQRGAGEAETDCGPVLRNGEDGLCGRRKANASEMEVALLQYKVEILGTGRLQASDAAVPSIKASDIL
jgi:hypothetical protein